MKRLLKKTLLACALACLTMAVNAQVFIPDGLSDDEIKIFEILGVKNPAYANLRNNTVLYELAWENLSRAGLLIRCTKLRVNDGNHHHFDSDIRNAVLRIVNKINLGQLPLKQNLESFKASNKAVLWAIKMTSSEEKQRLFAYLNSNQGNKILQLSYAAGAMANYSNNMVDVRTGMKIVVAPIYLKNYFAQSDQIHLLENIVSKLMPETLVKFRTLKSSEHYSSKDKDWLEPIAESFESKASELENYFYESLTKDDLTQLNKLLSNQFFILLQDAKAAINAQNMSRITSIFGKNQNKSDDKDLSSIKIGDRKDLRYNFFIFKQLEQAYPMPNDYAEQLYKMLPKDFSDNEHLNFCPPIGK